MGQHPPLILETSTIPSAGYIPRRCPQRLWHFRRRLRCWHRRHQRDVAAFTRSWMDVGNNFTDITRAVLCWTLPQMINVMVTGMVGICLWTIFLGLVAPGNNYKFDWECHLHGLGECCRKRDCCDFFASRRTVILGESEKEERFKMQVQREGRRENFCGFCCQQYNLPRMIGTEPAVPSLVDVWLTRLCIAVLRPLCVPFCSCGKKILMYLDRFGRLNLSHNHASFLSSNQSTSSVIIMNANHSCLS